MSENLKCMKALRQILWWVFYVAVRVERSFSESHEQFDVLSVMLSCGYVQCE